jgi:hypothetical protein
LRVRKQQPKTLIDLERVIHEEWGEISQETVQNLCNSIYARVLKCIEVFGEQINY